MSQKIALVTGGTGGIGTATCRRLGRDGYRCIALEPPALEAKAREWQDNMRSDDGLDVGLVFADVTSFESCEVAGETVRQSVGDVSVLVNAAGITRDATLRKLDPADWQAVLRTNLDGMFNVCLLYTSPSPRDRG